MEKNKPSFKIIGKQSQAHCRFDDEYMIPRLVYTNKELFPDRSAVVHLKCDQSRKTGDAKFDFLGVEDGNWVRRTANYENKLVKSDWQYIYLTGLRNEYR